MSLSHVLAIAAFGCLMMSAQSAPVTFTTLAVGTQSNIEQPRQSVVRTAVEWAALWRQHAGESKPPAVDFSKSIVIALFSGTRSTTGYAVEVTRIEKQGTALVVSYREQAPAAGDIVGQMLTSPFHIVRAQSHQGPVTFKPGR